MIESPHYERTEMIFQTWNSSRGVVKVDSDVSHPLWEMIGQAVTEITEVPGLTFWIEYQRKPTYYIYTLAVPLCKYSNQSCLKISLFQFLNSGCVWSNIGYLCSTSSKWREIGHRNCWTLVVFLPFSSHLYYNAPNQYQPAWFTYFLRWPNQ